MSEQNTERTRKIQDISYILKDLLKVIKVVYMYPEDNPLPQSLKRSFAEKLVGIVDQSGDFNIVVEKEKLIYDGETVFKDKFKEEALAAMFFETGITNFSFETGLDVGDVYKLLDVFKQYLNSPSRSYDIVSGFWEAQIVGFKFRTVEDIALAEYDGDFDFQAYLTNRDAEGIQENDSGRISIGDYQKIFQRHVDLDAFEEVVQHPGSKSGGNKTGRSATREEMLFYAQSFGQNRNLEDDEDEGQDEVSTNVSAVAQAFGLSEDSSSERSVPNTTIILNDELRFSEEEETRIKNLVQEDAYFEPYESTVELLKEMLLQETELSQFAETVTICEKIMSEFVDLGRLFEASQILSYLQTVQGQIGKSHPVWVERLKEALIAAGSREKLRRLKDSLNSHTDIGSGVLRKYLSNFGWEALSGITEILGNVHDEKHRDTICDHLAQFGRENLHIVSSGITDRNSEVVKNSITILVRIRDDRVYSYLEKALLHESVEVRSHLIDCLKDHASEKPIDLLARLARDRDSEIRRKAVQALGNVSGVHGFNIIADIINDNSFAIINENEQQLLLNTLSRLGGDDAVSYLRGLILKYNPLRRRLFTFLRSAAFEALTLNRGEKAERTLVRLSGNWRIAIRRMARDAMHKRRANLYGGQE